MSQKNFKTTPDKFNPLVDDTDIEFINHMMSKESMGQLDDDNFEAS